uniref:UDENN domain-containing protein n=1 Tax=Macrostomum lignano TaxID=282301 RepID=A0A1I8FEC0_9PLAT
AGTPCGSIVGREQLDQSQLSTGHQSIQASQAPTGEALRLNLLLSDSLLCLCRDHQNFEACNICVCHGDLTGSEAGLYMPGPVGPAAFALPVPASQPAPTGPLASAPTSSMRICATYLGDRRRLDYIGPGRQLIRRLLIDSLLNFVSLTIPLRQFRFSPAQQQQSQSDATNSAVAVVAVRRCSRGRRQLLIPLLAAACIPVISRSV